MVSSPLLDEEDGREVIPPWRAGKSSMFLLILEFFSSLEQSFTSYASEMLGQGSSGCGKYRFGRNFNFSCPQCPLILEGSPA